MYIRKIPIHLVQGDKNPSREKYFWILRFFPISHQLLLRRTQFRNQVLFKNFEHMLEYQESHLYRTVVLPAESSPTMTMWWSSLSEGSESMNAVVPLPIQETMFLTQSETWTWRLRRDELSGSCRSSLALLTVSYNLGNSFLLHFKYQSHESWDTTINPPPHTPRHIHT